MSIFSRLAIGTANWGKEYNGAKVSEDDQKRILDYCQCSGIDMIDTATAYEWDWTKVSSYFNVVVKVKTMDDISLVVKTIPYCVMLHDSEHIKTQTSEIKENGHRLVGYSLYEPQVLPYLPKFICDDAVTMAIVQVPYSIFDRRFELYFNQLKAWGFEIHVRSIFLQGKLLERFKPWECIAFCLMNPNVDRVIIGVDSYQQLKDNLDIFHRMNSAEIHDENILDPRKWERTE